MDVILCCRDVGDGEGGGRVGLGVFGLDLGEDVADEAFGDLDVLLGEDDFGLGLERDGVAEGSAGEADHLGAEGLDEGQEDAAEHLVGVGAIEGDVHAGVAALEAGDLDGQALVAGTDGDLAVLPVGLGVETAGAADAQLAFVLGVEIDEDVALQHARAEHIGARHAGFFVIGDENFDGAVTEALVLGDREAHRNADAVVGTEGGAVGRDPFAVDIGVDRVLEEVMGRVGRLLRDHVHVALEDDAAAVLVARSRRYADDHVAGLVLEGLQAVGFTPFDEVFDDFGFVLGRTGNTGETVEVLPDDLGIEILDLHGG